MKGNFIPDMWENEDGSVVVLTTFSLLALLGVGALAIDVGYWFDRSTKMSNVADLTAVSGARIAIPVDLANANAATIIAASKANIETVAYANFNGAVNAPDIVFGCWTGTTFTPDANCAAGVNGVAGANAVSVTSADPNPQSFFAQIFGINPAITRNAVAFRDQNVQACLITLNTQRDSLYLNGNINLNMPNCGIHVNGGIDGANSGVVIDTPYLCANGDIKNGYLEDFADNYCGVMSRPAGPVFTLPTSPVNGSVGVNNGKSKTFSGGGTFTKLDANNGGTVNLNGGKYVFTGNITVQGTLNATLATIILRNGATINVQGSGQIPTLTAPTTGDTAGYVLIEGCSSSCSGTSSLGGNTTLDYQGNIYLPSQTLQLHGKPAISSISTAIIVDKLEMRGTSRWRNVTINPSGSGPLLPTRVHLVQ